MKFIIDLAVGDYTGAKSGLATGRSGCSRERRQIFSRIKSRLEVSGFGVGMQGFHGIAPIAFNGAGQYINRAVDGIVNQ